MRNLRIPTKDIFFKLALGKANYTSQEEQDKVQVKSDLVFGIPRVTFPLQLIYTLFFLRCVVEKNSFVPYTPSPSGAFFIKRLPGRLSQNTS